MQDFLPTPEQDAIFSTYLSTKQNLLINAYAGCGKTTTIEHLCRQIPRATSTLVLAFNVKIRDELKKRLIKFPHCQVMTMNALGNSALRNTFRGVNFTIDNNKPYRLLRQLQNYAEFPLLPCEEEATVLSLYRSAMLAGLVPEEFTSSPGLVPDLPEIWQDFDFNISDDHILAARMLLTASIREALTGTITFDDQLYIPLFFSGKFPRFACIIIDEAQDLSALNHKMVEKCAVARIVVVGDEKQSCYAFRGAASDSMKSILSLRPMSDWSLLPLATTFRCPKLVVSRNSLHAPGFRANPSNLPGILQTYHEKEDQWSLSGAKSHAILCRNNAPLLSLAFKLLRKNIGVTFLGKDIGKSLIALFSRINPNPSLPNHVIMDRISEWKKKELAKNPDDRAAQESIIDRAEALLTIGDSDCRTGTEFLRKLNTIFSHENCNLTLSTIHRAKGREWDSVIHLDPWRLNEERLLSKLENDEITLEEYNQERNLKYILETRTKNVLIEAPMKNFTLD